MSDDRIREALDARAQRGEQRGADHVWAEATAEPSYVSPAPPPSNRWPIVAGAAAAALLLVAGVFVSRQSDKSAVTYLGEGSPSGPGWCLLEVEDEHRLTLGQWVALVLYLDDIRSAEPVDVPPGGTFALASVFGPPVTFGSGTRGVTFEIERVADAEHLADEPGATGLTCTLTPDGAWVPDPPPPGSEVLIVFYDHDDEVKIFDRYTEVISTTGVEAGEIVTRDEAWREFQALFGDEPGVVDAVSPELLPESIRVLVDESKIDELRERLEALPGVYRVVPSSERGQ